MSEQVNTVRSKQSRWPDYYRVTEAGPPRDTLMRALALVEAESPTPGFAIDLGCGAGNDTLELLRRQWRVLAIDAHQEAIERVVARAEGEMRARLEAVVASFANAVLPSCDLVNASLSLPFCSPTDFAVVWDNVRSSLRPGGRFAGHLFGHHDSWSGDPEMSFHTADQARALFDAFDIEFWEEQEYDGKTALGDDKRWHKFSVVARKR